MGVPVLSTSGVSVVPVKQIGAAALPQGILH